MRFPPNRKGKRKVRRAGSTVFDHCIAAAAHRREGWIFTIPMRFNSALTTVKRFDEWITEFSEELAARGQVIDKDVEYEIYRVLSAPSEALVMMVPCWSRVDIDRSQEKFLDKCGQRFRAVRHRMLCPGVQALIANNLCAPVPHNERLRSNTNGKQVAQNVLCLTLQIWGQITSVQITALCSFPLHCQKPFEMLCAGRWRMRRMMIFVLCTSHAKKFLIGSFKHRALNQPQWE